MTHRDEAAPAAPGISVVFADAVAPALAAGEYEVEVTQTIAGDIGTPDRHEYRHVQPLRVTGPHFGLGPRDVFSVHPPAGSDADWSGRLPSVVLTQRGLPWVIETRTDQRVPADTAPLNAPAPWCAVLLLTPEELADGDPEAAASPAGTRQILLTDYLTPPPEVRGPAFTQRQIARFRQEHPADFTVTTIDIPAAVFSRIAPSLPETRLLAHTRTVRDDVGARLDAQAAGDYAAVLGNRLVAGSVSGVYIAHLVSLEGFEDALPPARLGTADRVRLISLTGWTFTSRARGEAFADVMQRLDTGPLRMPDALGEPAAMEDGTSAPDPDPRDPAMLIRKALALGYTAADYRTRLGENTVAWYRGPLLPVAIKPNPQPPFATAEAALVYDPETGMFDVSFAAAWQAGRLLALAERDVATELAAWVRRARRRLLRALARDRLARAYPLLAPSGTAGAAARARALLAGQLSPDPHPDPPDPESSRARSGSPGRAGVWGPPIDPTGLLDQIARLPGLIAPDELPELLAGPGTPTAALLAAIRARTPAATPAESARPAQAPAEQPSRPAPRRSVVGSLPSDAESARPGQSPVEQASFPVPRRSVVGSLPSDAESAGPAQSPVEQAGCSVPGRSVVGSLASDSGSAGPVQAPVEQAGCPVPGRSVVGSLLSDSGSAGSVQAPVEQAGCPVPGRSVVGSLASDSGSAGSVQAPVEQAGCPVPGRSVVGSLPSDVELAGSAQASAEQVSCPSPRRSAVGSLPSELRALIADREAAAAAVRGELPPPGVIEWLDRLTRLHTIPFPLLVPDTRALPPESIRFAHLDANWISALVDGALSVAAVDEPGHAVLDLLRPAVHRALRRPPQRPEPDTGGEIEPETDTSAPTPRRSAADPAPALSGFLLRSTAVADFPGLIVQGYADRERRRPLTLRRLDRLSPSVLFALFEGRISRVDLATPAQGAGFGVLFSTRNPAGEVYLRGVGGPLRSGRQIPGAVVPVPYRADPDPSSARIVDIGELYASILRSLTGLYAPAPVPQFGPGAFGLQLVVGGEAQAFDNLDAPAAAEPAAAERDRR